MLSQTAQYALRAVIHIAEHGAEHGAERPVPVSDIAQALEVPRNYLSKTLHQLARAGIVASTFGPGGGFRLARPAAALTLDAVVAPFDGAGERHCLLGRAICSDAAPCAAHAEWRAVAVRIHDFFAHTTVAQLARDGHPALLPPRASRRPARTR